MKEQPIILTGEGLGSFVIDRETLLVWFFKVLNITSQFFFPHGVAEDQFKDEIRCKAQMMFKYSEAILVRLKLGSIFERRLVAKKFRIFNTP